MWMRELKVGVILIVLSCLLIHGDNRFFCFGVVGIGGASFCIHTNCKMKAHSANKVVGLEGAGFYIGGVVGATAFAQPSVREDQVPRSVQSEWEGKCWLLQRWVREFQAVANADSAIASNDNIKTEVNMLADAKLFRTP